MSELAQQLIEREKGERTGYLDTEEEFDLAWATFQKNGKPHILTYFKKDGVDPLSVQDSLRKFYSKLTGELKHFPDDYEGYDKLEGKIWKEIERMVNV
jgi:hypothetical protein